MKRGVWSFADPQTGSFVGKLFSGSEQSLKLNTPQGLVAIEGRHDPLSARLDLETGEVVGYRPPSPGDDYEWNADRRRWVKRADVIEAERRDAAARKRIAELETSQQRTIREHVLGAAGAADRIRVIDDEIKLLRSDLL